jgi:3-oxoadipate enol-lactonase
MGTPAFTDVGIDAQAAGTPTPASEARKQDAIVFLHGVGGGRQAWAPHQAHVAAQGWRSLAWDMPGYGDSPVVRPYDFEQLATAVWRMVDAANVEQVVLVGHSMGAMVALQAWTQAAHRVRAMVLAASSPAFGNTDGAFQQQFLAQRLAPLDEGHTMGDIATRLIPTLVAPGADSSILQSAHGSMAAVPPETYRLALRSLVQFDQRAVLPTITVPVLCLAGEHDRAAPADVVRRMAQKIPKASYACLSGAGHLLHLEQAAAFNAALETFLEDVKS